jgi:glycosyltransferase involved in cell wall biosynthesis
MKLGLVYLGIPLGYYKGSFYSRGSILNMLAHFSDFFVIDLVCPVINGNSEGYRVNSPEINVYPITGWRDGKDLYLRKFFSIARELMGVIAAHKNEWEAVWIIDPDPLNQVAYYTAKFYQIPVILYLRGNDAFEIIQRNKHGIRRFLASLWCRWLEIIIPYMLNNSLGIVAGGNLYAKYQGGGKRLLTMYASAVTKEELTTRFKTRQLKSGLRLKILMVISLAPYKGVDLALRAIRLLMEQGMKIEFTIVGTGPEENNLKKLAGDLSLAEAVNFMGFVPYGPELFKFYQDADLFLLPSWSEGTPKVIPEAFSFGCPVIASRVGGIPEMVREGYNGYLISPGNFQELAARIGKIGNSPKLLAQLRAGALATAPAYTVEAHLERVAAEVKAYVNRYSELS